MIFSIFELTFLKLESTESNRFFVLKIKFIQIPTFYDILFLSYCLFIYLFNLVIVCILIQKDTHRQIGETDYLWKLFFFSLKTFLNPISKNIVKIKIVRCINTYKRARSEPGDILIPLDLSNFTEILNWVSFSFQLNF